MSDIWSMDMDTGTTMSREAVDDKEPEDESTSFITSGMGMFLSFQETKTYVHLCLSLASSPNSQGTRLPPLAGLQSQRSPGGRWQWRHEHMKGGKEAMWLKMWERWIHPAREAFEGRTFKEEPDEKEETLQPEKPEYDHTHESTPFHDHGDVNDEEASPQANPQLFIRIPTRGAQSQTNITHIDRSSSAHMPAKEVEQDGSKQELKAEQIHIKSIEDEHKEGRPSSFSVGLWMLIRPQLHNRRLKPNLKNSMLTMYYMFYPAFGSEIIYLHLYPSFTTTPLPEPPPAYTLSSVSWNPNKALCPCEEVDRGEWPPLSRFLVGASGQRDGRPSMGTRRKEEEITRSWDAYDEDMEDELELGVEVGVDRSPPVPPPACAPDSPRLV
ncbi:hypothetical protein DXG01_014724 [Tephrocybe rancida]|nr:hypothetical protein DXG01_014724 [Tephrocybe rancida]